MENLKEELKYGKKGITLISLVVTIVVLLILAGVSIATLTGNNGLLTKASQSKEETEKAAKEEEEMINNLTDLISANTSSWTQTGTKILGSDGNGNIIILHVGDKVDYSVDEYSGEWKILGVADEGNLLITTQSNVDNVQLEGTDGYINGITIINDIAKKYAVGYLVDSSLSRSININDINRITGYNPKNTGKIDYEQTQEGIYFETGTVGQYGNSTTYSWDKIRNYPSYVWTNENGTSSNSAIPVTENHNGSFIYYDLADKNFVTNNYENENTEIRTFVSTYYYYYPETLTTDDSRPSTNISATSNDKYSVVAYNLLFGENNYWLASQCVYTEKRYTCWGLRCVWNGMIASNNLVYSPIYLPTRSTGVRPAVYLNKSVNLTPNGENSWHLN